MKFFHLCLAGLLMIAGCKSVQIFHTTPSSSNISIAPDSSYVYENDTVRVSYDFWANYGQMKITVTNKLNVPIYIDWKKCMLFSNGVGTPYYSENIVTTSNTKGHSTSWYGYGRNSPNTVIGSGNLSANSISTTVKQERISFVAQKASIVNNQLMILQNLSVRINRSMTHLDTFLVHSFISKRTVEEKVIGQKFEATNSICNFRILITYSLTESFQTEKYIDNSFFVSDMNEMSNEKFLNTFENYFSKPYNFYVE